MMTERELALAEEADRLAARLGEALDEFRANGPASRESVAAVLRKHDVLHAEAHGTERPAENEAPRNARR